MTDYQATDHHPMDARDVLDSYRQEAGLSHSELWLRYFEMGGMSTGFELEDYLSGALVPSPDHAAPGVSQINAS
jgi:hypothetical protein